MEASSRAPALVDEVEQEAKRGLLVGRNRVHRGQGPKGGVLGTALAAIGLLLANPAGIPHFSK